MDVDEAVSLTNPTPSAVTKVTVEDKESEIVEKNNNPSDEAVMSDTAGLKVSGCQHQGTSGSAIPFNPEQNCSQADTDSQDYIAMLEDVVDTANSIGLSEEHFDVVRKGQDQFSVCACNISQPKATSENPSCWGFTFKELEKDQAADKDLKQIITWLTTKEEPDEGSLFICSPEAKYSWVNKEICRLFRQKRTSKDLELVPDSLKEKAIAWHHDILSAAHQGIARTKAKLKEKFFWVRLSHDVESYVLSCSACSQNKKNKCYGKVPLTKYQAGAPMERAHINFIGPLPKTERGNEHCLMMVDHFTKWVECIPLPSKKAEVTARGAVDEFFSRFGYPFQLFSDQGRNFESKLFEALCKILEIHKARTSPYRPSANGQVERFNRTLMDAVRCFLGKTQNKLVQHVQQIVGAIRSSVNRSTGFTPNMLMLGREVNTPAYSCFLVSRKNMKITENMYLV